MDVSKKNESIDCHIAILQEPIKKVEEFQYLGSIQTLDDRCATKKILILERQGSKKLRMS